MPGSILGIDNHSVALAIDVAISFIYTDSCMYHEWTRTIYVLIGPFMFWHKWSGGTNYVEHKWSPRTTYGRTIYVVTEHGLSIRNRKNIGELLQSILNRQF